MRTPAITLLSSLLLGLHMPRLLAQQPAGDAYSLTVQSRLVIEDVSVTDRNGKPIHGLPESAFHLTDDGAPQRIRSFSEQSGNGTAPQVPKLPPGVQSNATLLRNNGTVVALLIDPTTIELDDQMYLFLEAQRFLRQAPPSTQIAVFRTNQDGVPVLLQPPTTDRALLEAALRTSVPVLSRPVRSSFNNATTELRNIADYLRPVPGRKALIWLSGTFPLYGPFNYTTFCAALGNPTACELTNYRERLDAIKDASRQLEQARIAVYPIDVRGVQMGGVAPTQVIDRSNPESGSTSTVSASARAVGQYDAMDSIAAATGGQALYSNNAVTHLMQTAVDLSEHAYTLSYQPSNPDTRGDWHTVHITVDGPYRVHYREGYYSQEPSAAAPPQASRHVLNAGGDPAEGAPSPAADAAATTPILFSARLLSSKLSGKSEKVTIRYIVPTDQLRFGTGGNAGAARFRLSVLACNSWGDVLVKGMEIIQTHYSPEQMKTAARIGAPADQSLDVPRGTDFLLLSVEDLQGGRAGVLEVPLASIVSSTGPGSTPTP